MSEFCVQVEWTEVGLKINYFPEYGDSKDTYAPGQNNNNNNDDGDTKFCPFIYKWKRKL